MINVLQSSKAITLNSICQYNHFKVEIDFADLISLKPDSDGWMESPDDRVWISFSDDMPTSSQPTSDDFLETIIGIESFARVT